MGTDNWSSPRNSEASRWNDDRGTTTFNFKYILYAILIVAVIYVGGDFFNFPKDEEFEDEEKIGRIVFQSEIEKENAGTSIQTFTMQDGVNGNETNKRVTTNTNEPLSNSSEELNSFSNAMEELEVAFSKEENPMQNRYENRRNEDDVETSPSKEKPESKMSTIELLEKRNHERVVEQAKRVGVSTEGSTTDILERITRKHIEKYK